MEPLTLKTPQIYDSPDVERWDDDDFGELDDIQFRAASTATSVLSQTQSAHRDSISSRLSVRSDSNQGDENWDVLVDEQASIKDAVALAKSKGIPLPSNVPRSALEGGTIRRLRGKEIKKAIADDWSEDLDLASSNGQLKLAKIDDRNLSESLRQLSAAFHNSPAPSPESSRDDLTKGLISPRAKTVLTPVSLAQFQDDDDDDGFGDIPTIKVAKHRSPQKPTLIRPPPPAAKPQVEDIEEDLEFPTDGQLRLSSRKPTPKTPQQPEDFDLEWAEGSLGTRNAGRRGGRSERSSSASALSPSVSSAFTGESEDEGMIGLVLPEGPLRFQEALKKRREAELQSPDQTNEFVDQSSVKKAAAKEDFFSGIEIGDGDVFDSAKLTLNRNVKHKAQRPTSPAKQRTTTTLNFTSKKSDTTISRLPRFQPAHERHERARSKLEPVSEANAVSRFTRPGSRLGAHTAQSSVSAIPAPSTPAAPSTPSRRGLRSAESQAEMRYDQPTTTNAQLLRAKRSMPVMRGINSPTKPPMYPRPPSRQEGSGIASRLSIPSRPKTPTERPESRLGDARRPAVPFLPAGASTAQSHHISIKTTSTTTRHYRRQDSDGSIDSMSAAQRSLSRIAGLGRPETPGRRGSLTPAELAAQAKKTITKPARRRNFGDGSELEIFDDLPTSATVESKFIKEPVGRGAPRSLRSKLGLGLALGFNKNANASTTSLATVRGGHETPLPITPVTPARPEFSMGNHVPRFARDTAASRNAREQRQVSTTFQNMRGEPLQPLSTNWKAHLAAKPSPLLSKKRTSKTQQKPHLIKPLGNDMNRPKSEKGMHYNPDLFRWEGNENALAPFDVPEFIPRGSSPARPNGSPGSKANVALISNVGANITGVQVVGGMVFDPRRMCWLKVAENSDTSLRGGMSSLQVEEEEDVFAGLEDLKEEDESRSIFSGGFDGKERNVSGEVKADDGLGNSSGDEWGVAEEFDVGPEFVRRQRSEEERWRKKVEKWLRSEQETVEDEAFGGWRWAIRDMVLSGNGM